MIIRLKRLFMGYLNIRLEGVFSEKILSLLAKEKIPIWNLKYSAGVITADIYARDFKKIRKIRRNTGVKIKITGKHGLPFSSRKYRGRSGFLAGAVIFFAILKFLSCFIWVINVEGNESIKTPEILDTLKSIGIHESMKISALDAKIDAQSLIMNRNDLAWAALNIEGCVLTVNVSEIKEKITDDIVYPSNLVAKNDGIIKKINAVSGDVRVKVGQNVHKGDLLVSGIIENLSSTVFVKSNAQITAQIEKTYQKSLPFREKKQIKTGKKAENRVLEILSVKIPLYLAKKDTSADVSYKTKQLNILGKKIPLGIYTKKYEYTKTQSKVYDEATLKEKLNRELNNFLNSSEIEGYIPVATEYSSDETGITVIHRYLCDEDIALENRILISQ